MKLLMNLIKNNKKNIITAMLAIALYLLVNSDGEGIFFVAMYITLNTFVFFVASKTILRTAVSLSFMKNKTFKLFVVEDKPTQEVPVTQTAQQTV